MLLRLKVKNFLSFYEESTFDMFPNLKRTTFENHIYRNMEIPLLKQAAIYGANGSGKSNLLEAIKFIRLFAVEKDFLKKVPIELTKFVLLSEKNSDPIFVSVEFFANNQYFLYEVEIVENSIQREELFISGIGKKKNELVYSRKALLVDFSTQINSDVQKAIDNLLISNPLSSLLSLNKDFPILPQESAKVALQWFEQSLEVLSLHRVNPALISLMSKDNDLMSFTNHIFSVIGLGIQHIDVEKKLLADFLVNNANKIEGLQEILSEMKDKNFAQMQNDKVLKSIEQENGEQFVKSFIFHQIGLDNFVGRMEYELQSDGTARILNLIPAFYELKNKNCVYFIDEIESSIHPSLIVALLKFFAQTQTKGQLIFTTHETELLDQQQLMRPDEVWFAEKRYGNTHLYSLNDFKEHNTINIKNGYLEGRYGAIPFIGNLDE
jgi:AAA15 family ATPase/GTPase